MRRFLSRLRAALLMVMSLAALSAGAATPPDDTLAVERSSSSFLFRYDRRTKSRGKGWGKLVPQQVVAQMYGDIGLVSVGCGWDYGKRDQWESHLLFGYVPKYNYDHGHITMTLKETFVPWSFTFAGGLAFEPLTAGMYFNAIFGDEFWTKEPDKYTPDGGGYYRFSSRIRINIFMGEQLTFTFPADKRSPIKAASIYYEISTCDLYLISRVTNSTLKPRDFLRLAFGVKLKIK